ncbi:Hypothetical predicted protein [Paramuricea clavata]|uniref:Uncharacterized protein n=1 Tax=Paramuricea clavata TaxID=317549 RepID=A0A7D9EU75_PARCT|nr:Hypothetical predicted protein [Paramuricea clavata]
MPLISPTFGKRNPLNREGYSSRSERPVDQRVEDNPSNRQGASGRSKRRPGSDCAIDTTLTHQVSISDAKDEEISTNIATNHIHRFTTTVQKCESNYQTNSNQQNILKQNLSNKLTNMYTNRQSIAGTSRDLNFLHEYKNNNHMKNVCRFALCNDIETNPGLAIFHIDPSKTVSAPYNQGNQIMFGETAGQQCLAIENSQFEQKAVVIEELEQVNASGSVEMNVTDSIGSMADLLDTFSQESQITDSSYPCKQCSAISLYSICYSIIKPSNYWDSKTVAAVVYFGTALYNKTGTNTSSNLPKGIEICGTEVHVKFQANYQGKVNVETERQKIIESLICHKHGITETSKNKSYSILAYDDNNTSPTAAAHFVKNIGDKKTLVDVIFNLAHTKIKEEVIYYEIQYLSCSSRVTDSERKSTVRRHNRKYNNQIMAQAKKDQKLEMRRTRRHLTCKHLNQDYRIIDNQKKKKILESKRAKYQALDETSKQELLKKERNHYKERKQKLLKNKRTKYQTLDETSKQELLKKQRNHYKERKQKLLENKSAKYQTLNETSKQELLTKNMNSYKIMEEVQNKKILESEREK